MAKPYGRKTKKKVGLILSDNRRPYALEQLARVPDEQLIGHLFSYLYSTDELIRFRSSAAMGFLGARIASYRMEKARIILRRIMWNLNDESGGIGWGSPEAMGEILCRQPELAMEFKSILLSYLIPGGTFIEHELLQRGVIWGIGTYLEAYPADLSDETRNLLYAHLHSEDKIKRGYAVRALINANNFDCSLVPENIMKDTDEINIFTGWNFVPTRISDMSLACENNKTTA